VQSVVFDSHEWSEREARAWLDEQGFRVRALDRDGRWWRSRQREPRDFDSSSFRTVDTVSREVVTMASNPKRRRGKKRRAPKKRRRRSKLSRNSRKPRRAPRPAPQRARRSPRRARRARARASGLHTIAMTRAGWLLFARRALLKPSTRTEMRRHLRTVSRGSSLRWVSLPTWWGSRAQAVKLALRVRSILKGRAGHSAWSSLRVVPVRAASR
jgi:hypothetical protein